MLHICHRCEEVTRSRRRCDHCGGLLEEARKPSALAILGLSATLALLPGCMYGIPPIVDEDDDGYYSDEDCDDADPDVHPGAEEVAGDDVDSNCDGEDDP